MGQISKEELAEALDSFVEVAMQALDDVSAVLLDSDLNRRDQRSHLIRKIRLTQAFNTVMSQEDPMVAFLEMWGLTARILQFTESGYGYGLFSEHQDLAIKGVTQLNVDIEVIGQKFLGPETFEETRKRIKRFAGQNPIADNCSNLGIYATDTRSGEASPFADILSIPMAPFTAMKGVDKTAGAIYSVRGSIERAVDVIDRMPDEVRWQLLLVLMDLEDSEMVKSLVASASTFSNSSAELADVVGALPGSFREEATVLIKEIDDRQSNIQTSLDKAETTAKAVEQSFLTASGTFQEAGKTVADVEDVTREWKSAVEATTQLLESLKEWRGSPKDPNKEPAFRITDYKETAQSVSDAAIETGLLVDNLRSLIESEDLMTRIEDVNDQMAHALDLTSDHAMELTDYIFWRIVQLVGVIFLLALVYRTVSSLERRWALRYANQG